MTAQDLKNSILQLAVQGKLVQQNPNDEPASELLKRIKTKKRQLIREGKVTIDKKHTPSPITEDDILYDLPNSWCWVRFADIVSFYSGKTPERHTASYWNNGEHTWVSIADMISDGVTFETKEKITQSALIDCFSEKISPTGTMIMSFKLTIGKVSILGVDAVHNEAIISLIPFVEDKSLKDYLFKILPLVSNGGDSKNAIKGKTLNATSISNLMIPLPPLAEQERIVAKIEELLPLIAEYDKAEQKLSELNAEFPDKLRKSILQQAVQGKLTDRDPTDEPVSELLKRIYIEKGNLIKERKIKKERPLPIIAEEKFPFEIPDNWVWARLDDLVCIRGGKRMPKGKSLTTTPTAHVYIRVTDMQNGTILDTDLHYVPDSVYPLIKQYIIEKDDVYIVIVGSTIGKTGIVPERFDKMNLTENAVRLTPIIIDKMYLKLALETETLQVQLMDRIRQEGQPKLAIIRLRSAAIPLPPLAEQKRIVEQVEELLAVCGQLK